MRQIIWLIIVIIAFLGIGSFTLPKTITLPSIPLPTIQPSPMITQQLVKVTKVIDGDTIEIETGQRIRYIGIDTPEINKTNRKSDCYGEEAKNKNKELVEGKMIRLEKDVSETDRYRRLLRYVYVIQTNSSEELFVNEYLVKEGYASSATFPPDVKYADHFRNLQLEAREQNKGFWLKCQK